ncbi:hypothetical protein JCM9279_005854 [Rhodotorula babjevae]
MAARALTPVFTRSYKPASAPPDFQSAGGRPWEDLSLKLDADKPHHAVQGLLPEGDQLASLPLELLLLICEHASFGTLLALSRTTKALRRLLLSRSRLTEELWELVREKEGWPISVDKEMSIVRYAYLLDGSECEMCGDDACLYEVYMARLCDDCYDEKVATKDTITDNRPYLHESAFACVLHMHEIFFEPDVLLQSAHLYRLEALASRQGRSRENAVIDYVARRSNLLVELSAQADVLEQQRVVLDEADRLVKFREAPFQAACELKALGYKPEDYGDLTDEWWYDRWWWAADDVELGSEDGGSDDGEEQDPYEDDDDLGAMTWLLKSYFIEDDGDDLIEWDDVKLWIVTYAHRRSLPRVREEAEVRRTGRKGELRPLVDQVLALLSPSLRRIAPSFDDFAFLPVVRPLWYADSAVVDPSTWSASHPAILADVLRSIRALKIRLFSRLARTLPSTSLPQHLAFTLSTELADVDPRRAPLHHLLPDADLDPILARPSALFRCGVCSTKLVYPHIVEHLRDEHGASAAQCAAWACAPDERFGEAVRALLEGAEGLGDETTDEELRSMGVMFRVEEEIDGGHVLHSLESWEQLTSGWHAEDPDAYCYKIDSSHDRRIVGIRLAR